MGGTAYKSTININHRKYYYSSYHPSGEGIPLLGSFLPPQPYPLPLLSGTSQVRQLHSRQEDKLASIPILTFRQVTQSFCASVSFSVKWR